MANNELYTLLQTECDKTTILLSDNTEVGKVPTILLTQLKWYKAQKNFNSKPLEHIILLDSYDKELGEFFVYTINSMYFYIKLDDKTIVWFYKIHDEYGLPEHTFKRFCKMRYAPHYNENNPINTLVEITKLDNDRKLFMSEILKELELRAKTKPSSWFWFDMITKESLEFTRTRTFICYLLKIFNFRLNENEILENLVSVITKYTDLTEKCLNDLLACINWWNVTKECFDTQTKLLESCENFKITKTMLKGIQTRENLVNDYSIVEKNIFQFNQKLHKFPMRNHSSYTRNINFDEFLDNIYVYTTTINPKLIEFEIEVKKQPSCTRVIIKNKHDLFLKIIAKYTHNDKIIEKKMLYYKKDYNNRRIDLPLSVDSIELIFNKVYHK